MNAKLSELLASTAPNFDNEAAALRTSVWGKLHNLEKSVTSKQGSTQEIHPVGFADHNDKKTEESFGTRS